MTKRGGWLAFVLGLLFPGLGQFFTGHSVLGAGVYAIFVALEVGVTAATPWWPELTGLWAAVVPVTWLLRFVTATVAARSYVEERRGVLALMIFAALTFGGSRGVAWVVRHELVEPFKLPSASMEPTLQPGDLFAAVKRGPAAKIVRGAVVAHEHDGHVYVRRVIGLPGEKVELSDGQVTVNGKAFGRERCAEGLYHWEEDGHPHDSKCEVESADGVSWNILVDESASGDGAYVVPTGSYFLLGDNRGASNDSRFSGPAREQDLKGVVTGVWMSTGPGFPWVRFERIGLRPYVSAPPR